MGNHLHRFKGRDAEPAGVSREWRSWNGVSALAWTVERGNKGEADAHLGAVYWAGPPGAQRINLFLTRGANHNFKASPRPISPRPRGQTSRQPSPGGVPTGLIRNGCSAPVRHTGREGFDQRRRRRPALRCIASGRAGPGLTPPQRKYAAGGAAPHVPEFTAVPHARSLRNLAVIILSPGGFSKEHLPSLPEG